MRSLSTNISINKSINEILEPNSELNIVSVDYWNVRIDRNFHRQTMHSSFNVQLILNFNVITQHSYLKTSTSFYK